MPKRRFFAAAATILLAAAWAGEAGIAAAGGGGGELSARAPAHPVEGVAGTGLRRIGRQGALLYVPSGYRPDRAAPLLVMLHGAGGDARHSIGLARADAERLGFLLLAPKSKGASWDIVSGRRFGADVSALDSALKEVFADYSVDPGRVAVGGFSDGASYALSLGLINGELFSDILAFSPGFIAPARRRGRPRILISHGTADRVLPILETSRRIVPELKRVGYTVGFEEFAGGHEVPGRIARRFFEAVAAPRHSGEGGNP
ncbi:MAG TPA: PHB depolymerase family esterase [Allosphingosinicella sp.]|nr:PHB depolymerase family esterase [Allosphingosinicella sp.]